MRCPRQMTAKVTNNWSGGLTGGNDGSQRQAHLVRIIAVIVVLIVIGYAAGWFGGTPTRAPQQ